MLRASAGQNAPSLLCFVTGEFAFLHQSDDIENDLDGGSPLST
jgi:hypothetical protein